MKKLFIVSASLLVLASLFLLAYNIAFKKERTENGSAPEKKAANFSSSEKKKGIYAVSEESAMGIFLDSGNEKIKYYSAENGNVFEVDLDGKNKRIISEDAIVGLEDIKWSPTGDRVISKIGEKYFYYDYKSKKGTGLKSGLDTIAWDNTGTKIFYKFFEAASGERSINISNPDGSDWRKLASTGHRDVEIAPVPQTSEVSFWNSGRQGEETSLEAVSVNGGEVRKLMSAKKGADYKWSPNGSRAIVGFVKDGSTSGITTGIINTRGEYVELGIPTLASKMVWSLDNKHVYYALPSIPQNSTMPDDYKSEKITTADTFWKVNVETGESKRLVELNEITGEYDATNLFLSPSEIALFFLNRLDGKIYRLDF
ncbi:MAG: hypothetical protein UY41_C0005G0017 [Candidatus Moranbacteria bacterium GW2011_GWE1_49_15]|nr:MAG: hypothetical protein UX75_C0001G0022 [Candidatus Moranbacteria bacterium GW2011_GWE2_47_10]KKW07340.1 MAG: hypothetical protein UY41_C0005G0017 [Candidatus Moranbacteria bacterium GW2011_GWE1_49_15]